jgi:GT2 family glycosyltransferase
MYHDVTIIIPTIDTSAYLLQCVLNIKKISNSIKIIIISDKKITDDKLLKNKFLKTIQFKKKITISKKRNIGVKKAKTKFIGFIDSDAYPHKNWIKNSIKILNKNKNIFLVGGPNVSPQNQSFFKNLISDVQKSFLISGKWSFQKRLSSSRFTENLYSCNMIMKKKYFLLVDGMDENLIAGEDFDFCQRIRKLNKQVFFNKHSIVYHHDRNLKNFITQKIIRGFTIVDQIKKKTLVFKNNILSFIFYQLIPLYFFIFNLFCAWFYFYEFNNFYISNLIIFIYSIYISLLIFSAKYSKKNILKFPLVLLLIYIGNLLIGFGSFISIFGFKNIINFYKNT